jgi:hypothetical protein
MKQNHEIKRMIATCFHFLLPRFPILFERPQTSSPDGT